MPIKIDFTPEELKQYFNGRKYHYYYKRCNETARDLKVHATGIFPQCLIEERRPNEPAEVFDYRKKIYIPKTKPYFSKIETSLQKIRRSSDWSIRYDLAEFTKIPEEQNLMTYCEEEYPVFGSVTDWVFATLLRAYLVDPNSLIVVMPTNYPESDADYYEPEALIFDSANVIDYETDNYLVAKDPVGVTYIGANNQVVRGESYYAVTTKFILKYDQINGRRQFEETLRFEHGYDELPVVTMGGIVVEKYGYCVFRESRIAGIVPEFNEALREYSDLQAAKVLHLFPERWEYTQTECTTCKGTGQVMGTLDGVPCQVTCQTCHGKAYVVAGVYSKITLKPIQVGEQQVPIPPAGFVEKDVEIIKVQEDSVERHIYNGLSSINFEFLTKTPLNQSGIAKEVDKDELNNTAYAIAEDLVSIMDDIYYWIAKWRYSATYPNDEDIQNMCPRIAVPEKFDIFTSAMYQKQFDEARKATMNPTILNALEVEYANKAFNNDPEVRDRVALVLMLDPLANILEDEKMSRLANGGITKENYIISSNINWFVQRAIEENPNFPTLSLPEQKLIIQKYAAEQTAAEQAQVIPIDTSMTNAG